MTNSEKGRMLSGLLYDAADPQLVAERQRVRQLLRLLNVTSFGELDRYRPILTDLLPNAAPDTAIEPPFFCDYGYNIFAGEKVSINFNCVFLDVMPIKIGSNVLVGPNVQIYTATHPLDALERRQGLEAARPITIGDDCWIGGSVVICPGVTIGDRCVIGAGAVVTRSIPPDSKVGGNPARPLPA